LPNYSARNPSPRVLRHHREDHRQNGEARPHQEGVVKPEGEGGEGGGIPPEKPIVDRAEVISMINKYQGNWKALLRKLVEQDEKLANLIYELLTGEDNA